MVLCQTCSRLPDEIKGESITDIPGLFDRLDRLNTNFNHWVAEYRCIYCGQIWEERYKTDDFGEIPIITKRNR